MRIESLQKFVLSVFLVVSMSACSTIVHEKEQQVIIRSNPSEAILKIDNRTFTTPAAVPLKGKSEYYFTIDKPGYKQAQGKVDGDFRIWSTVVGNIFNLTGFIGFAVDFWGTETAYEMKKDNTVTLEPLAETLPMQPMYPQPTPYYQPK